MLRGQGVALTAPILYWLSATVGPPDAHRPYHSHLWRLLVAPGKGSSTNGIERDDDSRINHPALRAHAVSSFETRLETYPAELYRDTTHGRGTGKDLGRSD